MKTAIIGTAGRNKDIPMSIEMWEWMLETAADLIPAGSHLVSGGAAWADHVAVQLFLEGHVNALTLHLPAPFNGRAFDGPYKSAASAANFYHRRFSFIIGVNSLAQIQQAADKGAEGTFQPAGEGYQAMFARNRLVAQDADSLLAFTFGTGDAPNDGGTLHTWNAFKGNKTHITIPVI